MPPFNTHIKKIIELSKYTSHNTEIYHIIQ